MKIKVTEYDIHNCPILEQMSTSIKVILEHFSIALTVSRYLHFKIRGVKKVAQGRDVQHSQ